MSIKRKGWIWYLRPRHQYRPPVPAPAPAPAPTHIAPSVNNDEINLDGWDFGGTRLPAWGNTRPAAVNREPAHDNGWGPAPCPAHTNESSHTYSENDPQRMDYVPHRTPRANPKEKGNINPLTIRESVEEIPTKIWEEKCAKERNGTVMVCL